MEVDADVFDVGAFWGHLTLHGHLLSKVPQILILMIPRAMRQIYSFLGHIFNLVSSEVILY